MKKTPFFILFSLLFLLGSPAGLYAEAAPIELEIEMFHDCTPQEDGLVCQIPEDAITPPTLKALEQFQKPISVGWIPSLGVFIVTDQEKPSAHFYKLNTEKTALLPTDVQTEIKNVQSQVTTTTPGQTTFQVQYQLGQNAEQNKKNADLSILRPQVAEALPHPTSPYKGEEFPLLYKEGSGEVDRSQIVVGYDYDAINRLVGRQTQDGADTTSTQWAYFDLMRTVEYNRNRTLDQLEFFHGVNGIDYLIPKSPRDQSQQSPAKGLALHKDTLGSPAVLTKEETGDLAERNYFSPFGDTVVRNNGADYHVSKLGNPILYTGQYYDATAELYLFPYRAYDPQTGKFLQRDPIGFADGPNPTAYVGNSPFNLTDPLGLAKKNTHTEDENFYHYFTHEWGPDLLLGFMYGFAEDNTFGLTELSPPPETEASVYGQIMAHCAAMAQGLSECAAGKGIAAGGGGLVMASIPAMAMGGAGFGGIALGSAGVVAGAGVATHGTLVAGNGLKNLNELRKGPLAREASPASLQGGQKTSAPEKMTVQTTGGPPVELTLRQLPEQAGQKVWQYVTPNGDVASQIVLIDSKIGTIYTEGTFGGMGLGKNLVTIATKGLTEIRATVENVRTIEVLKEAQRTGKNMEGAFRGTPLGKIEEAAGFVHHEITKSGGYYHVRSWR
ncbi:MAG: RHS repeat-associated core domain-containing protein [Deltaproteobacteria bacterium]|nr:RHS repeat-associated core domain-containing protein [Deltaproteobacteria bacterium]